MKTKTIITEITKEDLVNLFSTALYGSHYWGADYDKHEYNKIPNPKDCECYEEKLAKMLLNGKPITIYDMYAEDEEDFHGSLHHEWDEDNGTMDYKVTLKDIEKGLQKCLDGTFKVNSGFDEEIPYMRKCVTDLINIIDSESGDLDLPQAENILQVIVFGQIIYG